MRTLILALLLTARCRADDDPWELVQTHLREGTKLSGGDVDLVQRRLEMNPDERGQLMALLGTYVERVKERDASAVLKDPLILRLQKGKDFYWLLDLAESEHEKCVREKQLTMPNCADFRQNVPTLVLVIVTMAKSFLLAGYTIDDATPEGVIQSMVVDARQKDIVKLMRRAVEFAPDAAAEAKAEQTESYALLLLGADDMDTDLDEATGQLHSKRKDAFTDDDEAAWNQLSMRIWADSTTLSEEDVELVYKRLSEVVNDRGAVLSVMMLHISKLQHDVKALYDDPFVRSLADPESFEMILSMAKHEHETCVRREKTATTNCEAFREHAANLVVIIVQQAKAYIAAGKTEHFSAGLKAIEAMVDKNRKEIKALMARAVSFAYRKDADDTLMASAKTPGAETGARDTGLAKAALTQNAGLVDTLLFRTRDSTVEYDAERKAYLVTPGPGKKRKRRKKKKKPRQDL